MKPADVLEHLETGNRVKDFLGGFTKKPADDSQFILNDMSVVLGQAAANQMRQALIGGLGVIQAPSFARLDNQMTDGSRVYWSGTSNNAGSW